MNKNTLLLKHLTLPNSAINGYSPNSVSMPPTIDFAASLSPHSPLLARGFQVPLS